MDRAGINSTSSESFADRIGASQRQEPDLRAFKPDELREVVYRALARLPPKQRNQATRELIDQLQRARVNVASRLFTLGIPARTVEELTPSDVAMLMRSVQVSNPEAMKAISANLGRLLARGEHMDWRRAA